MSWQLHLVPFNIYRATSGCQALSQELKAQKLTKQMQFLSWGLHSHVFYRQTSLPLDSHISNCLLCISTWVLSRHLNTFKPSSWGTNNTHRFYLFCRQKSQLEGSWICGLAQDTPPAPVKMIQPINKAVISRAPNGGFYLLNFKMHPDMQMEPGRLNTTMMYLFFLIHGDKLFCILHDMVNS